MFKIFSRRKKYIYGLRKLNTNSIVYVGQSFNPEIRLVKHIKDAKMNRHVNFKLGSWIIKTLNESTIVIEILDIANEINANRVEKYWIDELNKTNKFKLFNIADPTKPYSTKV